MLVTVDKESYFAPKGTTVIVGRNDLTGNKIAVIVTTEFAEQLTSMQSCCEEISFTIPLVSILGYIVIEDESIVNFDAYDWRNYPWETWEISS